MNACSELLRSIRRIIKLFETSEQAVCRTYSLSLTEVDVLAFLANNPGLDTATDIVELRMIPKANVSQAVDALIRKELLIRQQDMKDRRRIHLTVTPKAAPIIAELHQVRHTFAAQLLSGFSPQEITVFSSMNERIAANAAAALKEMKPNGADKQ